MPPPQVVPVTPPIKTRWQFRVAVLVVFELNVIALEGAWW
jgi:hypothetical protein